MGSGLSLAGANTDAGSAGSGSGGGSSAAGALGTGCGTFGVEDAAGVLSFTGTATEDVVVLAVSASGPSDEDGPSGTSDAPAEEVPAAGSPSVCDPKIR